MTSKAAMFVCDGLIWFDYYDCMFSLERHTLLTSFSDLSSSFHISPSFFTSNRLLSAILAEFTLSMTNSAYGFLDT